MEEKITRCNHERTKFSVDENYVRKDGSNKKGCMVTVECDDCNSGLCFLILDDILQNACDPESVKQNVRRILEKHL